MGTKEFDYYIFVDYSENLIGYTIIEKQAIKTILPKISRLRHYSESGNRKLYLKNVKNTFKRERILDLILSYKIREMRQNMDIFIDIGMFVKEHPHCLIFASIDNKQYNSFQRFVHIVDGMDIHVIRESELKVGSPEYQLSLILDNWLNIERLRIG